jgi:hypothetical protein
MDVSAKKYCFRQLNTLHLQLLWLAQMFPPAIFLKPALTFSCAQKVSKIYLYIYLYIFIVFLQVLVNTSGDMKIEHKEAF